MFSCVSSLMFESADNKGFICKECGTLRDMEEIKKIASEVKLMSEKASTLHSSGSILWFFDSGYVSCWKFDIIIGKCRITCLSLVLVQYKNQNFL